MFLCFCTREKARGNLPRRGKMPRPNQKNQLPFFRESNCECVTAQVSSCRRANRPPQAAATDANPAFQMGREFDGFCGSCLFTRMEQQLDWTLAMEIASFSHGMAQSNT